MNPISLAASKQRHRLTALLRSFGALKLSVAWSSLAPPLKFYRKLEIYRIPRFRSTWRYYSKPFVIRATPSRLRNSTASRLSRVFIAANRCNMPTRGLHPHFLSSVENAKNSQSDWEGVDAIFFDDPFGKTKGLAAGNTNCRHFIVAFIDD